MRIRSIKPEVFMDEDLWDLEMETGLPIFRAFTGLWCAADKAGRFAWRPRILKPAILPHWNGDFSRVLDALTSRGFLVRYACSGKEYGWVRSFGKHQVPNNKEKESVLPPPPELPNNFHELTRGERVANTNASPLGTPSVEGEGEGEQEREPEENVGGADSVLTHPDPNPKKPTTEDKAAKDPRVARIAEHYRTKVKVGTGWSLMAKHNKRVRAVAVLACLNDGYTVEDVCKAIDGYAASEWHLANGELDLELIVRNIEKGLKLSGDGASSPPYYRKLNGSGITPAATEASLDEYAADNQGWRR